MAIKPLNSVAGFSVGEYPTTVVVDTSGNVSANGLTVARTANLGAIGNITITGGLPGQFLQTDGTGVLSWQTVSAASLSNGTSNIQILDSGNVTISSAGAANVLTVTSTGVYVSGNISATNGTFSYVSGNGSALSALTGANVTGTVANASYATLSGTVTTNAQPNITSVGTLTSLSVTGNSSSGNVNVAGKVVASTLESNVVTGTAPFVVASTTKVTNLNADLLDGYDTSPTAVANTISVRDANANVTANYFIGNGSQLTGLSTSSISNGTSNVAIPVASGNINLTAGGNTSLVVSSTGANVSGNLTAGNITAGTGIGGSITGANLVSANFFTGTLTTAAQPNITSVGTLTTANVTGNITSISGVFVGNGAGLTNINGSNVTGTVANSTYATSAGTAVTVTANAQPNITSVGNLSSLTVTGNLTAGNVLSTNTITSSNGIQITSGGLTVSSGNLNVTGNINVTGNLNYSNVNDLVVGDPLIYIGANNTGDLYDLGIVGSYNEGTYYHTGLARDHTTNYWTFFDGVVAEPTTVIDWANATYPTVKVGSLFAVSNVSGSVLSITGNADVGNISAATATFTTGNITTINSGLLRNGNSNITITPNGNVSIYSNGSLRITASGVGANVSGTFGVGGNANFGNIGTATGVFTANITAGNVYANSGTIGALILKGEGGNISNIQGANVSGTVSSATTSGTVTTNAQPNITSVGTLTTLVVSGNVSAGNISGATGTLTNANISGDLILGNATVATTIKWASANTSSITANQTIATVSATGITGVEFLVKSIDASGSKYSVSTVQAVTDGTNVDYSTFGSVNIGGFTGALSVSVVTGSINLQVTPASSNSTMWTTQYRLI